ncbi:MAG: dihydrodipicolinate synthase family protein [Chloroflexi bacterium]|nr:dihydrodipicolinate synthase family protein [Chloroflexota bacterium]
MKLKGLIVPLITPLNPDESLDEERLARVVEYVLEGGADGIFALGSAGEFPNLRSANRERLVRAAKDLIGGRVPLLVGIARAGTRETVEEGKRMARLGADAFVALPPYYYVHSQSELVAHFQTIAHALDTPLVLYNIPQFVKHTIAPETVARLAEDPSIMGIKNTDLDMDAFDRLLAIRDAHRNSFSVSQGDLPNAAECLLRGADGITLGVASVAPRLCKELYNAAKAGDRDRAEAINRRLIHLDPTGLSKSWFAGLKMLASLLDLCEPMVAMPFEPCGQDDAEILRQRLVDVGLLPLEGG